jgi:hypothetical protein
MNENWRMYPKHPHRLPTICFRTNGMAFNDALIRAAKAEEATRVTIYFDKEKRRIGVVFHCNAEDKNSYALSTDGWNTSESLPRIAQTKSIYKTYPIMRKALRLPPRDRKISASLDEKTGIWFVKIPVRRNHREASQERSPLAGSSP